LQLIGAPWSEVLLSIAAGYESLSANAPWRDQDPTDLAALGGAA
jgi:hypothetical protein